jgi:hypothetical protein
VVAGETHTAKRRQRSNEPCDGASKGYLFAGAAMVDPGGGRARIPRWLGVTSPAGVLEQGAFGKGFIQEPGRPRRFHSDNRLGSTGIKTLAREEEPVLAGRETAGYEW